MGNSLKYLFSFILTLSSLCGLGQSRVQGLNAIQFKKALELNFVITPGEACKGYQIERSDNSIDYEVIYDYAGYCGDVAKPQSVSFSDENPLVNTIAYYRIHIPPSDYSETISVTYIEFPESGYILFSNPISNNLKMLLNSSYATLELYDTKGNKIDEFTSDSEGIINRDISTLENGFYFFIVKTKNEKTVKGNFLKGN